MVLLIILYWPTQFLLRSVFKEGSTTRTCSRIELRNRVGQTWTVSHGRHRLESLDHEKSKPRIRVIDVGDRCRRQNGDKFKMLVTDLMH